MVHGSWLKAHGSCLKARGSRLMAKKKLAKCPPDVGPNAKKSKKREPRDILFETWACFIVD